ncbi:hypothetical protein FNU79_18880 [Deinococcus detaillensis]|uniref:Uncharacterized protein n=1 Tax=Deinococcus detaillensis TaxID=2592048 RepID=A0A553UEB9_9DEIO|nr:hypothetical protein [Deinococcus detaillensis]TSA78550.1 hypothetical protein FNU79_18880 [Deinococcus detaillensis]
MNRCGCIIKSVRSLGERSAPTWEDAVSYGKVIARMGRKVTITDLYSYERHVITADGTTTPIGKLIVRRFLGGAWNDGLN